MINGSIVSSLHFLWSNVRFSPVNPQFAQQVCK